jgi:hypothetical protein
MVAESIEERKILHSSPRMPSLIKTEVDLQRISRPGRRRRSFHAVPEHRQLAPERRGRGCPGLRAKGGPLGAAAVVGELGGARGRGAAARGRRLRVVIHEGGRLLDALLHAVRHRRRAGGVEKGSLSLFFRGRGAEVVVS